MGTFQQKQTGDAVPSNELPRVRVGRMVLRRLMTVMSSGSSQGRVEWDGETGFHSVLCSQINANQVTGGIQTDVPKAGKQRFEEMNHDEFHDESWWISWILFSFKKRWNRRPVATTWWISSSHPAWVDAVHRPRWANEQISHRTTYIYIW